MGNVSGSENCGRGNGLCMRVCSELWVVAMVLCTFEPRVVEQWAVNVGRGNDNVFRYLYDVNDGDETPEVNLFEHRREDLFSNHLQDLLDIQAIN
ncbi:hypothetical protein AVEN_130227-1 [Araneus ventricosus]|uniref:Uncharacterized protein n=1 Tax=Araneus ventricosus TaxID=182803 RepID=A0A4Y2N4A7_ARAVE|nr:hypothetical protein AVEN_130227-1 [Araneus ventricosus]